MSLNFTVNVLDEISLEGLDGITLSALWLRLSSRTPALGLTLDEAGRSYLWSQLILPHDELRLCCLQEARGPLVLFNWEDSIDPESEKFKEPEPTEEIVPFSLVRDKDIVGSCSTYHTRVDVTDKVRSQTMSLEVVQERFGELLVIVASQRMREKAIFPSDKEIPPHLPDKAYCFVERIARSRHTGEVTVSRFSVKNWLSETPSNIFYMKRALSLFVESQAFSMRNQTGLNVQGSLLHLPRFFHFVKPVSAQLLEKLTRILSSAPRGTELLQTVREKMNISVKMLRKLAKSSDRYVVVETRETKDLFPELERSLLYHVPDTGKHPRSVHVVRMIQQYTYKGKRLGKASTSLPDPPAEGIDFKEEPEEQTLEPVSQTRQQLFLELPLLQQTYNFCEEAGHKGMSQIQVSWAFGVTKLEARLLCRNLEKIGSVRKLMVDLGKQREQRYVAESLVHTSDIAKGLVAETNKIIAHHKEVLESSVINLEEMGDSVLDTSQPTLEILDYSILGVENQKATFQNSAKKHSHVTYRLLKRANIVLEMVKEAKVIDSLLTVQKHLRLIEKQRGEEGLIDKKCLLRLINRLDKNKQIKVFRSCKKILGKDRELTLLCDMSITADMPIVKNAIESAFNRMIALPRNVKKEAAQQYESDDKKVDAARPDHALLFIEKRALDMIPEQDSRSKYNFKPRMKKYQKIYEVLWYLIYGYGQPQVKAEQETDEDSVGVDEGDDSFEVYMEELNFRRYLPPLPHHKDLGDGWFLFGDILLLLPLKMFLQIVRFNFSLPQLDEYLAHPKRQWRLLCQLPTNLRRAVMHDRKYLHSVYNLLQQMNHFGLISIGKREYKEKEQISMYLHRNLTIIDTRNTSVPEDQPLLRFNISSHEDIQYFWFNLQWICLQTPLTHLTNLVQQETVGKTNNIVIERFKETSRAKTKEEIIDEGTIPGNQKGAGGLDSYFYSHLKRNWVWFSSEQKITSARDFQPKERDKPFGRSGYLKKIAASTSSAANAAVMETTPAQNKSKQKKVRNKSKSPPKKTLKKKKVPTATLR